MTATPLQLLCYDRTFRITPKLTIELIESLDVTLALFVEPEKPQVFSKAWRKIHQEGAVSDRIGHPKLRAWPPRMRRGLPSDWPM